MSKPLKSSYYQNRKEEIKMKRLLKNLETTGDPLKKKILQVKIKAQEVRVREEAEKLKRMDSPLTLVHPPLVQSTRETAAPLGFTLEQQKKLLNTLNRHESSLSKLPLSDEVNVVEKREILQLKIADAKRKLNTLMNSITHVPPVSTVSTDSHASESPSSLSESSEFSEQSLESKSDSE